MLMRITSNVFSIRFYVVFLKIVHQDSQVASSCKPLFQKNFRADAAGLIMIVVHSHIPSAALQSKSSEQVAVVIPFEDKKGLLLSSFYSVLRAPLNLKFLKTFDFWWGFDLDSKDWNGK